MRGSFRLRGVHVLAGVLAFFGVVIAANAVMVTLALRTFSGLEAERAYSRGNAFNDVLAARRAQAARGWTAELGQSFTPTRWTTRRGKTLAAEGAARITLAIRDAQGKPVSGLLLSGRLARPATSAGDIALVFAPEPGAPGLYAAEVATLPSGHWILTARAPFPDGAPFETQTRLWMG